jgi:starch synthase
MLSNLKTGDFEGFVKLGMEYSDAVITSDQSVNKSLNGLFEKMARAKKVDTFEKGDSFTDSYFNLYNELVG